MAEPDDIEALDEALEGLEDGLTGARAVTAAFAAELDGMTDSVTLTRGQVSSLANGVGASLRDAFEGVTLEGLKLSDALSQVARSLSDAAFSAALAPVENKIGDLAASGIEAAVGAGVPFAHGGAFTEGRVVPFADGGVVSRAAAFAMAGGRTGVMGEAGPEAILPLSRGADGKLGVRAGAGGGQPVNVTINVTTPDVAGFRRSQSQIAAEMGRALSRGQRNR